MRVLAATLAASALIPYATAPAGDADAPLTAWMQRHAQPFATCSPSDSTADLEPLRRIVANARIVALGEGTHGTREFFQLKHRITQFLATEMGFSVFAIEANLPEAWRVNDYVLGGAGDPRALLAGMYFWTWNTEEVLEMIEWMRRFNTSGRGRIEFTGFDMQFPDTAAAIVRRFLGQHDPAWTDSVTTAERAARAPGFVTSTGILPVAEFAGHKVRYSGYIRTAEVSQYAGLWMRADAGETPSVAFDNMAKRELRGTTPWQRHAIELDIPATADKLVFGVLLAGHGTAWFDSLAIEVDQQPWQSPSIDLELERADGFVGLGKDAPPRFAIAVDEDVARSGERSLRLSGTPEVAPQRPLGDGNQRAARTVRRLVEHLEATRTQLGQASTPAEADFAIRNAHVVLQHALSQTSRTNVRDSSMAANVVWIAEAARQGAKVVIWAHNGHVAKQQGWMGKWLAERYAADMVVVGFAANEGTYTAVMRDVKESRLASDNLLQPGPLGSIEFCAHATGLPRFFLDLRPARETSEVATELRSGVTMRSIGALAMDVQFHPTPFLDYFDVLAWVDSTAATRCFGFTRARK